MPFELKLVFQKKKQNYYCSLRNSAEPEYTFLQVCICVYPGAILYGSVTGIHAHIIYFIYRQNQTIFEAM